MKLKLQFLATAMAVATRPSMGSTQSYMTAFFYLGSESLFPNSKLMVLWGRTKAFHFGACDDLKPAGRLRWFLVESRARDGDSYRHFL